MIEQSTSFSLVSAHLTSQRLRRSSPGCTGQPELSSAGRCAMRCQQSMLKGKQEITVLM
jgi:hypothetical protein